MATAQTRTPAARPVDAVVVAAAVATVLLAGAGGWTALPAIVLGGGIVWLRRLGERSSPTWVAAVVWACVALASALSFGLVWPIPQVIGIGVAAIALRRQGLPSPGWVGRGDRDRVAGWLAALSVPVTTLALVAFIASGRTDLATATAGLQPLAGWLVPLAGLGFALVNPLVEEVLFRGVLQTMVADRTGRPALAVTVQGAAFGAIHLRGVPGGWLGMAMAGAWGVALGVVRHRTGSIRIPWVVHVLANITIFATVVVLGLRDGVL